MTGPRKMATGIEMDQGSRLTDCRPQLRADDALELSFVRAVAERLVLRQPAATQLYGVADVHLLALAVQDGDARRHQRTVVSDFDLCHGLRLPLVLMPCRAVNVNEDYPGQPSLCRLGGSLSGFLAEPAPSVTIMTVESGSRHMQEGELDDQEIDWYCC